jgi:phosphoglycolate phosphatase
MNERFVAIVDLDGPLLDGRQRHYACYSTILAEHGAQPLELAQYWDLKRTRADRREQLAASGAEDLYDTFLTEWLDRIEGPPMLALDRVQPGAIETLSRWRAADAFVVLATHRRDPEALRSQLDETGLSAHLDEVVPSPPTGGAVGKAESVVSRLGRRPDRGVWVGDTEVDVAAARHLGLPAWAVACGVRSEQVLRAAGPDMLAADLASLPVPC